jgi:hypothetical protein
LICYLLLGLRGVYVPDGTIVDRAAAAAPRVDAVQAKALAGAAARNLATLRMPKPFLRQY